MKTFNKQPPKWAITALVAGISGVFCWFVILPMQQAIGDLHNRLEEQRAFVLEGERLRTELVSKERELDRTRKFTEGWSQRSPDQGAISSTLGNITSLAKHNQLAILRFEPNDVEQLESLYRSTTELKVEGELQQIRAFLYDVESISATVWAANISLRKASSTSDAIECDIRLTLFADNHDFSD